MTLVGVWRAERVSMHDVQEVRWADQFVVLEVDDGIMEIGPFGEPERWWERLLRGSAGRGGPSAPEVAAAVDHARVAAAVDPDVDDPTRGGRAGGPTLRFPVGLLVLALAVVTLAGRYLMVFVL
jgi:hypothetical protein